MIVTVVRCDRCKKLVDSDPPQKGHLTAGYYSGWYGEEGQHVCNACMWADPRHIADYGDITVSAGSGSWQGGPATKDSHP